MQVGAARKADRKENNDNNTPPPHSLRVYKILICLRFTSQLISIPIATFLIFAAIFVSLLSLRRVTWPKRFYRSITLLFWKLRNKQRKEASRILEKSLCKMKNFHFSQRQEALGMHIRKIFGQNEKFYFSFSNRNFSLLYDNQLYSIASKINIPAFGGGTVSFTRLAFSKLRAAICLGI